jgi:uncharacterized protein (DUF3820 family)
MKSTRPFGPDQAEPANTCVHCGSERIITLRCVQGPHFGRLQCKDCGAFVAWDRKPITLEAAARFEMPFGKWHHCRLADIPSSYLQWIIREFDNALSRRAELVLADRERAPRGRRDAR